ncbi:MULTISPECIES: OsmC family protein [Myroides]|uniref:OsmC family peroxiredoxin n=1 Tax=Myroides albus TaxID=2562892 RepID=A0A6I3LJU7_9FLAO|nr:MULTISPECIES: OsmC family protein [Myroides]MTG96751.1 OsmC family peroxiredoxin [Myroides albus]MVX35607.1 OsmC family peroxiredoxin [Myroides sp. LoEW2-1]UVD80838.1 OsmC family protein [Myroides albus]
MSHKVTTTWIENMQFESTNPSGDTIRIDAGPENGGDNKGLRPKALMLSALAGCSGLDIAHLIKKMRLEVDEFKMETEGKLTDSDPSTYHTVVLDYHFYGSKLDEAKLKRAVDMSIEKYCGVMNMFKEFAKVETNIHYHNK